jgi:hypothetical protein
MSINTREWFSETISNISKKNVRGIFANCYNIYVGTALCVENKYQVGTNIFQRDWDVLIILDACRYDAIREIADEYDFIGDIDKIWSVGSTSLEWLTLTFQKEYQDLINHTSYVSGNPYIDHVFYQQKWPPQDRILPFGPSNYDTVTHSDFEYLDEIRRYGVDHESGSVPSRVITDRAISVGRSKNPNRLIVHYMRPHEPYDKGDDPLGPHVIQRLQQGDLDADRVWNSYLDNLRGVLDEVRIFLNNIDAEEVVITADHGEAFGEWGFYGHTVACPHPSVRRVPWIKTTAEDNRSFDPDIEPIPREEANPDVQNHLEELGYL